ncbi:MAG: hypothetical protein A3G33_06250 [Omnitrophica bacterium RIFCSPLOWO2_12_FULL_44_17]|uniref:Uncharacterized protein n=1 Tax=Candidatus Danuiimicrobium aquiferis TaxID=1801832 RepID=A0A1G1KVH9_9BACT|nr:MAG: hypothetical protein A3B72_04795 [Omnitrophica bacterium RIFCSPHIGHO2_02_FULL_45_28]OGW88705.1 MAG: hypothetical protein A3E74_09575 [Omnitrophica bacterium RIFCSPHIGHO2_12_FULL_44_12]OGW96885.1 MAG: hypothetical protein A3G33_06250 [Omnitrophica bacterium RIFCSPLOWO2_12_FULL_44_17]OGX02418.1 MAG: hypothetical protein A3J12_04995 [Omnitrophica bacterium RIFCSPLOWO2_02_FULL_44_11]
MVTFKNTGVLVLILICSVITGCGYTQEVTLPNNIKTVAITTFEDKIPPSERYAYYPGLEIELTNNIIDQFIFDGNLKVVDEKDADAVLKGDVVAYKQEGLRYDNLESIEEYRLYMIVNFELVDRRTGAAILKENGFSGRSEFFVNPNSNASRKKGANSAVVDTARNIVDRIVEEW